MGGEYFVSEEKENVRGFRDFRGFRAIDLAEIFMRIWFNDKKHQLSKLFNVKKLYEMVLYIFPAEVRWSAMSD